MKSFFAILVILFFMSADHAISSAVQSSSTQSSLQAKSFALPLCFVRNDGQIDKHVKYYANHGHISTYFTNDGIYLSFLQKENGNSSPIAQRKFPDFINAESSREIVKIIPVGASRSMRVYGDELQQSKFNFFLGNDKRKWRKNVSAFRSVVYKDVYPGVDLKFYSDQSGQLEYDILISSGADPTKIKFIYEGIRDLKLDETRNLIIELRYGKLIQHHPKIFQRFGNKTVDISGSFKINSDEKKSKFVLNFDVGRYDRRYALVIDPVISYSTYFGGVEGDSIGGVDIDSSGFLYITGGTESPDFPITPGAYQTTLQITDGFISKLTPDGSSIVYSTYLGGNDGDGCNGIKVDETGAAYVACFTASDDFPTINPFQANRNGEADSTVSKLSPDGSALLYSTYLGGSDFEDWIVGIGLKDHQLYAAGTTTSTDFPLKNPFQSNYGGGPHDGFITVFTEAGNELIYSSYLGGSWTDYIYGVAVGDSGDAVVTGTTDSQDFPVTPEALDRLCGDGRDCGDAFVSKIAASGTQLIFSTYLGGSMHDDGYSVTIDSTGAVYVAGSTTSKDFPTVNPIQPYVASDVFITKIAPDGASLIYSTFLGGWGQEDAGSIAIDNSGSAYVTGSLNSNDFPKVKALPFSCHENDRDVFVTKISPQGDAWDYSTCFGGRSTESVYQIAVDNNQTAYVVGYTLSPDFPIRNAIQPERPGFIDGFITKILCDSASGPMVYEDAGHAIFNVHFCRAKTSDVVIQYSTSDGTARAGSDYVSSSASITIPAGETEGTIQISLLDDTILEREEDFFLELTSDQVDLSDFPIRASLLDSEGYLYDNFEDGVLDWHLINGIWREGGGYLAGWAPRTAEIFAPVPWIPSGDSGCSECTIATTIYIPYTDMFKIVLEGWYQNSANKVELILNAWTNKWILKQRSEGRVVAKSKAPATFKTYGSYSIFLEFDGINFNLTVNGQHVLSMKSGAIPFGNVGFKTRNYMKGVFRQIWIY